jgi:hypothetical protein
MQVSSPICETVARAADRIGCKVARKLLLGRCFRRLALSGVVRRDSCEMEAYSVNYVWQLDGWLLITISGLVKQRLKELKRQVQGRMAPMDALCDPLGGGGKEDFMRGESQVVLHQAEKGW